MTHQSQVDRAVSRVMSWTRLYTTGLPDSVRADRLEEVRSDLHEQASSRVSDAASDRAMARAILSRSVRGGMADVGWRRFVLWHLPFGRTMRMRRVVLALAIAIGAATSTTMYVSANTELSSASQANTQVGFLSDQVHGEALFLIPLASQDADDLHYLEYDATDPIYAKALIGVKGGVLAEYNNLRLLLPQLATEQAHAARVSSAAGQHELVAQWLTGLSAVLFALFAFVVWFEPLSTRARRDQNAKS